MELPRGYRWFGYQEGINGGVVQAFFGAIARLQAGQVLLQGVHLKAGGGKRYLSSHSKLSRTWYHEQVSIPGTYYCKLPTRSYNIWTHLTTCI